MDDMMQTMQITYYTYKHTVIEWSGKFGTVLLKKCREKRFEKDIMRKFGNKEKMYMQTVLATVSMPDSDSDEDEAAREFLPAQL